MTTGQVKYHQLRAFSTENEAGFRVMWEYLNFQLVMTMFLNLLSLTFTLYLMYNICTGSFTFFTWHPLCMSMGCGFLMFQGIYAFSWKSLSNLTKKSSGLKVTIHWALQVMMLLLVTIGFVVAYWNKNSLGKYHFATWHAQIGLASIVFLLMQSFGGLMAKYPKLSSFKRPLTVKAMHSFAACATTALVCLALITGMNSKFFLRLMADSHPIWKAMMAIPPLLVLGVIGQVIRSYIPRFRAN